MTIDEAIIHCEEVAIRKLKNENNAKCVQCGEEHVQLAKWLKELKDYKSREDVVPVVRCENCIHWSDSDQCARPELSGSRWHDPKYFDTYPDDFCSYGERKE